MCPFGGLPSAISTVLVKQKDVATVQIRAFVLMYNFVCLLDLFQASCPVLEHVLCISISNYILARQLHNCTLRLGHLKVSVLGNSAQAKVLPVKKEYAI